MVLAMGRIGRHQDDDGRTLDVLDRLYGHAYDLAIIRGRWVACGLVSGRWLVGSCAAELRRLIDADTCAG